MINLGFYFVALGFGGFVAALCLGMIYFFRSPGQKPSARAELLRGLVGGLFALWVVGWTLIAVAIQALYSMGFRGAVFPC